MITLKALAVLVANPDLLADVAQMDLRNTLPVLSHLRKKLNLDKDLAAAAVEMARLRQKAADSGKFDRAENLFFTADALQQATHEAVARYHAQYFHDFQSPVLDLGCGIGGDAIHIGQVSRVIGVDIDPVRLLIAQHNARVYQVEAILVQADLREKLPVNPGKIKAAFFDPARRSDEGQSRRIFSVQDYIPPLDSILNWPFEGILVKLSPGVNLKELEHLAAVSSVEFISYRGDLKEALLHYGTFQFSGTRATCLPDGGTLISKGYDAPPVIHEPRRYIYEPDPSVIRSGLFGEMLEHLHLEAFRLDESIAYLTGDSAVDSPWLRSWEIHDWMPFNLKKLKVLLRQHNVGRVIVKKRGSPIAPEELQKRLKLKAGKNAREATVFLTRLQGQPVVLISYSSAPGISQAAN